MVPLSEPMGYKGTHGHVCVCLLIRNRRCLGKEKVLLVFFKK